MTNSSRNRAGAWARRLGILAALLITTAIVASPATRPADAASLSDVSVTGTYVTSENGTSAILKISLETAPSGTVGVAVSSDNEAEGIVGEDYRVLSFTTLNYSIAQTVVIYGVDDHVIDGNQTYHIYFELSGGGYDLTKSVTLTNNDNDAGNVNVVITPTSGLTTSEVGTSTTFSAVLSVQPGADVCFDLATSDGTEGTLDKDQVCFTSAGDGAWNIPHIVTITGVDDDLQDGAILFQIITEPTVSLDPDFDGLTVPDVAVTNYDNDTPNLPTITHLSPASGPVAGGTSVTITGTNFVAGATVTFDSTPATSVAVVSGTTITAVSPAHAAGTAQVRVTVGSQTSSDTGTQNDFKYQAAPTITSLSPASGPIAGGTEVTISGTGFGPDASVKFGGTAATISGAITSTSMKVITPAHAQGSVEVTITTAGGTNSTDPSSNDFTYSVGPAITGLSPNSGPVAGNTAVLITGFNFASGATVKFGAVAVPALDVSFISSTTLSVVSPPAAAAGLVNVQVTVGAQVSSTSGQADDFLYTNGPVVTAISPAIGPMAGGTSVTITGTGFTTNPKVWFGDTQATCQNPNAAGTSITCTSPANATEGKVDVMVSTVSAGDSPTTSAADDFFYAAPPTVGSLSPSTGPITGGTVVTVTGSHFTPTGMSVTFGETAGTSVLYVDPNTLTVISPVHAAGTVDVVVTTPGGETTTAGSINDFLYKEGGPVITSVVPNTGSTLGGTRVTINGSNFSATNLGVTFGGVLGTNPTFISANQIQVTTPPRATTGTVDVVVTTVNGASAVTASTKFTYALVAATTRAISLYAGWTDVYWTGVNGISIADAIGGIETPANAATVDISASIQAIWYWDPTTQSFKGWFASGVGTPGANDLASFEANKIYRIKSTSAVSWVIIAGN